MIKSVVLCGASVLVALLLLVSCSGPVSQHAGTARSSAPSPSPSSTAVVAARYQSVAALRDAAVKYGYPCPSWEEADQVELAEESGTCSDDDVFMIFASDTELQKQVKTYKDLQQITASSGIDPSSILVGPNWIINGERMTLALLGPNLGGDQVDGPAPSSSPSPSYQPEKADWRVGIKILKKECFGSAGCNITFRINPSYVGDQPLPDSGTIEVTYRVSGDEDGPQINTFTVEDRQASYDAEEDLSTPSSATKVRARVTEVSYDDN